MYTIIEKLQENSNYHYIDYIPFEPENKEFLELENYFEKNCIDEFSKKITNISLKMIYYLNCEIYLTYDENLVDLDYEIEFDTNIRNKKIEEINYIIQEVIKRDLSSIQIYFRDLNFLISIYGLFSVAIYNLPSNITLTLKQLVQQEGLFLKINDNEHRKLV